jgi:RNA polymerase nonessential primary-like sigma factor
MTDLARLSNEELVVMYQQTGDEEVFEILWKGNQGLLHQKAHSFEDSTGMEEEDLVMMAYTPFQRALNTFDGGNGAKFSTYLIACVTQYFSRIAKANNAQCRGGGAKDASYEALTEIHKEGGDETQSTFTAEYEDYSHVELIETLRALNLTEAESVAVRVLMAGGKKGDIAEILGITGASVTYHIRQLKKKLSTVYSF